MSSPEGAPKRSRLLPIALLVGALLIVAIALFAGWIPRHRQEGQLAKETRERTERLPKLNVLHVQRAPSASELQIPGTTLAYAEAYIYARSSGYVTKRLADIGDRVRANQLLAVIDAPDLDRQVAQARSSLAQSEANLVQVQAQLHLASLNWDRYKVLVKKGVFSRQEGDNQEANFRVAEANVNASASSIEGNRENLNRLKVLQEYEQVRAPFAGVITARNIDVGALINGSGSGLGSSGGSTTPGASLQAAQGNNQGASGNLSSNTTPATGGAAGGEMFSIADVDRLRVLVSVPEAYTRAIHVGQRAALTFPEHAAQKIEGRVTRTSASIDQNTRTLLVEVLVRNLYHLVPGMYVVVNFLDISSDRPLTIPGSAIAVRDGKTTVGLIDGDTVHLRPVALGRDYGDQTEIMNGLVPGDVIATNVTDDVTEGSKIDPQFAKSATPAGASSSGKTSGGENQYGSQKAGDALQKKGGVGNSQKQ